MVLDNERCQVEGCTLHVGYVRTTKTADRNRQIREDWQSGEWTLQELGSFWELAPVLVAKIVSGLDRSREVVIPLQRGVDRLQLLR